MKNPATKLRLQLISGLAVIALIATAYALRSHFLHAHDQAHAHSQDHDHDHGAAELSLHNGQRWETDEPLRLGMERIRDAVALLLNDHSASGQHPTTTQVNELADTVQKNVTYLIQNCQLAPEADANLHVIINDLMTGASLLKSDPQSAEGAEKLVHALHTYPVYFDHPNWTPLPAPRP